jgi:hypothetical protein
MKLGFSGHILKNIFQYQISLKSVQWDTGFSMQTDRQTDRQTDGQSDKYDEANSLFSQSCERAKKTSDKQHIMQDEHATRFQLKSSHQHAFCH